MASLDMGRHRSYRERRRSERREYLALVCVIYPFCLAAAVAGRLGSLATGRRGAAHRRSVFGEALGAATSTIPFAFR
jgi:nitrate reductase NapE component